MNRITLHLVAVVIPILLSFSASAGWKLDPDSSHIGFASVKNDLIAENHTFTSFSGVVSDDGKATVEIQLASVETLIPIRNERMQALLFDVARHPIATVGAQLDINAMTTLKAGESITVNLDLTVELHGTELRKAVVVKVSRSGAGTFDVTSLGPIIVHASQFALSDGVEALRKIAGLQSIDLMVPVTFALRWVEES